MTGFNIIWLLALLAACSSTPQQGQEELQQGDLQQQTTQQQSGDDIQSDLQQSGQDPAQDGNLPLQQTNEDMDVDEIEESGDPIANEAGFEAEMNGEMQVEGLPEDPALPINQGVNAIDPTAANAAAVNATQAAAGSDGYSGNAITSNSSAAAPGPSNQTVPSQGPAELPPGPTVYRSYQPPAQASELNHRIFRNRETASILPPVRATLWWVGFDYQKLDGYVRVEVVTRGDPRFAVLQEVNQSGQPELLLRFYETDLRPKIRRSINATEFRSPVSFIRMRESEQDGLVDVLITLRDAVRPRLYAKQGDVLLTFEIPERYYGNLDMGQGPIEQAQVLPIADIRPIIARGSDMPEAIDLAQRFHYPDHTANAFSELPAGGGELLSGVPTNPQVGVTNPADLYPQQNFSGGGAADLPSEIGDPASATAAATAPIQPLQAQPLPADGWAPLPAGSLPPPVAGNASGATAPADAFAPPEAQPGYLVAPSPAQSQPNFPEVGTEEEGFVDYVPQEEQGQDSREGEEELFKDDGLDDFDDGEGDFQDPAAKFEVRLNPAFPGNAGAGSPAVAWQTLVRSRSLTVGQDDGESDFDKFSENEAGLEQDTQFSNQGEEFSLENPGTEGGNEFAQSMNDAGGNNLYVNPATSNPAINPAAANPVMNPAAVTNPAVNPAAANPVMNPAAGNPAMNPAAAGYGQSPNGFSAPGSNAVPVNAGAINAAGVPVNAAPIGEPPAAVEDVYPGEGGANAQAYTYRPENPTERLISVSFKDTPLDYVMKIIMEESKINYILSPAIQKTPVTIEIHDEPWSLALKGILDTHSLGFVELSPTYVRIDTLANLDKEKETLEAIRQKTINLTPPKTLVHRLSYAKAEEVIGQVTKLIDPLKHGPMKLDADKRTNSLVIIGIPTTLALIQEIIKRIDLPTPQVDIASRIIETSTNMGKRLGIAWGFPITRDAGRGLGFGTLTFPNHILGDFAVDASSTQQEVAQATMRFGSINNGFEMDMALQFGQNNGFVEILQTNNVVVQDNTKALINTGQIDYIEVFADDGNGLQEINYTLSLEVTPQITSNGMVNMKIKIDSAEPATVQAAQGAAARSTKNIETELMRKSGETAVIGGLFTNQKNKSSISVPFFGSIPIIGALFRNSIESTAKREIMIMITPTILTSGATYDQQIQETPVGNVANSLPASQMFNAAATQAAPQQEVTAEGTSDDVDESEIQAQQFSNEAAALQNGQGTQQELPQQGQQLTNQSAPAQQQAGEQEFQQAAPQQNSPQAAGEDTQQGADDVSFEDGEEGEEGEAAEEDLQEFQEEAQDEE